jgi:hypothetical protein
MKHVHVDAKKVKSVLVKENAKKKHVLVNAAVALKKNMNVHVKNVNVKKKQMKNNSSVFHI